MSESVKRHEENSNMIKEIRTLMDAAVRNQGALIKILEIRANKQEAYSYRASHIDNSMPRKEKDPGSFTLPCYINNVCFDNALADLGASINKTVKYPKGIAKIGKFIFPVDFIILDMPEDVKVPLILGRPFLSTAHAKIDVFKRKITLRVGDEKIIFKSVKPASSLIKRVYMLSLRERMELDLEATSMGETLVLNRSLDQLYEDYIELNDLNVPLEFRRDQVDDLMPTIKEGEVIEEFRARNDARMVSKILTMENMDSYRDQDIGDIILGEPFCKASCVEARRFYGLITIHNGPESPLEFQRSWYVKGHIKSGVISSVLMQRIRRTMLRRNQAELDLYYR
ncbi:hypothetical protein Tco_0340491 [Tanacetum coccineum]